jgi:hypothetical protein
MHFLSPKGRKEERKNPIFIRWDEILIRAR